MFPSAKLEEKTQKYNYFPIVSATTHQSYVLQTPAIFEDEGNLDGVYRVHDTSFKHILAFNSRDPEGYNIHADRLVLVHGDQKTTSFIRHIQFSQLEASLPYDRKQWILPVPAFFHVELNYLVSLFRVFWDWPKGHSNDVLMLFYSKMFSFFVGRSIPKEQGTLPPRNAIARRWLHC